MTISVNFYIIHVSAFKQRKATLERLEKMLQQDKRLSVSFKYITEYDPDKIDEALIKASVNYDQIKDEKCAPFNMFIRNMHINQLSNVMKHNKAYQLVSDGQDVDFSIILEDDIVYNEDVTENLVNILKNIPETYDMVFLGLPSSQQNPPQNGSEKFQVLSEVFKVLPCCDSYVINKKTATMFCEYFTPIKFPQNIQLSYVSTQLEMENYISIPNIFIDGSKLGLYFSTLEVNNRLIFNQDYVILSKYLEKETFTDNDHKEITQAFREVKLKTNPEFYYLKALYEIKKGNYEYAEEIFKYTYEIYDNNGAILNNQSNFLRDYMRLYKHMQTV
jgi:GR25 family glycosyltransferase involved in LPS biosynthesis